MSRILIIGGGGHAKVVIDAAQQQGMHQCIGVIDPGLKISESIGGVPVLGADEQIDEIIQTHDIDGYTIAIGDPLLRSKIRQNISSKHADLSLVNIIHPSAWIARDVSLGRGITIMAGAVVQPGCRIEDGCLINTRASMDHDSVLSTDATLAPGVTLAGQVYIAHQSHVGIGATIIQQIRIGARSVIGAGAVVIKDIPDEVVAYGVPARVIRARDYESRF